MENRVISVITIVVISAALFTGCSKTNSSAVSFEPTDNSQKNNTMVKYNELPQTKKEMLDAEEYNPKNIIKEPELTEEQKKAEEKQVKEAAAAMNREYLKKKAEMDKNDTEAAKVVKKYLGKEVKAQNPDKYDDYKTMGFMVDILTDHNPTAEEATFLKNYLHRRVGSIDDNPDLKSAIDKVLYKQNIIVTSPTP